MSSLDPYNSALYMYYLDKFTMWPANKVNNTFLTKEISHLQTKQGIVVS